MTKISAQSFASKPEGCTASQVYAIIRTNTEFSRRSFTTFSRIVAAVPTPRRRSANFRFSILSRVLLLRIRHHLRYNFWIITHHGSTHTYHSMVTKYFFTQSAEQWKFYIQLEAYNATPKTAIWRHKSTPQQTARPLCAYDSNPVLFTYLLFDK